MLIGQSQRGDISCAVCTVGVQRAANLFPVRGRQSLIDFLDTYDIEFDGEDGALTLMDRGEGGMPRRFTDDGDEIEIADEIAPRLARDAVCILYSVGFENRRHLAGQAVAVHAYGKTLWLDLFDIADRARDAFGADVVIQPDL